MTNDDLIKQLKDVIPPELISQYGKDAINAIEQAKVWVAYNMPEKLSANDISAGISIAEKYIDENLNGLGQTDAILNGIGDFKNSIANSLDGKLRRQDVLNVLESVSRWLRTESSNSKQEGTYLQTQEVIEKPKEYSWDFPEPMEKLVAEGILQDNRFYDFDAGVYDYTKIKLSQLDNSEVRQAIMVINPGMDTVALTTVARRNTGLSNSGKEPSFWDDTVKESPLKVEKTEGIEEAVAEETPVEEVVAEEAPVEEVISPIVKKEPVKVAQPTIGIINKRTKKPLTKEELEGAVAWRQGIMYKLVYPPYSQEDIINSRQVFPGVTIYEDVKAAYRALIENHRGTLPPTIVRDMGMMTIQITDGNLPTAKMAIIEKSKAQRMGGEALSAI